MLDLYNEYPFVAHPKRHFSPSALAAVSTPHLLAGRTRVVDGVDDQLIQTLSFLQTQHYPSHVVVADSLTRPSHHVTDRLLPNYASFSGLPRV
ncbi:unnamed protein product [Protopolystoma xenopodis]|uniref:Uncharacterized protein n=1 Tax=Protopolystoma xenopodis TaxID=117903 RepID=A0A448XN73_9PLAT|nr:unnamed protein product [Protopolystoma xenopodis]